MWLLTNQNPLAAGLGDAAPRALASDREPAVALQRRGAVREMLAALEHATLGGRHHLMRKVLVVLAEEVAFSRPWLAESQRRSIAGTLATLEREATRRAPDGITFVQTATQVVDALSTVT
jgi:hypothetical protein